MDIEDMSTGISIMDLGLNEFRLDLMEYIKHHPDLETTPLGLHAVTSVAGDAQKGVIFVLKNRSNQVNIDKQNLLHPFYMTYIQENRDVFCHYLAPKKLLDTIRLLCKGRSEPLQDLCREFNKETQDGLQMNKYSALLGDAIESIIAKKEQSDIDSLFTAGGTSALENEVAGLNDFELICFLVVKGEKAK